MATFYEQLKTKFDAEATLVPTPFSESFIGSAPNDIALPVCVVEPDDEVLLEGGFGSRYTTETFTFRIFDATEELVNAHTTLVEAAFLDSEADFSVTGLDVIRIEKVARRYFISAENEDLWEASLSYEVMYREVR